MEDGQAPTPSEAPDVSGGKNESIKLVRDLKREAQRLRSERNAVREELESIRSAQAQLEKEAAERQGNYEKLYAEEVERRKAERSQAKQKFLRQELQRYAVSKGLSDVQAQSLAYPTKGVKLTDDYLIEGDISEVMDPFLEPFLPKETAPVRPIAIKERQRTEPEPELRGTKAYTEAIRKKLLDASR